MSEDLRILLAPPGRMPGVGQERLVSRRGRVMHYADPFGSHRYLYSEAGRTVCALQVVSRDGRRAVIANVYTLPDHRRQGLARELLEHARRDFRSIEHSPHLSEAGAAWQGAVGDPRRRQSPRRRRRP